MKDYIGLVLLAVGGSTADSDCLIIPIALTAIGLLLLMGETKGES